ncbi:MAG: sporulation integral membrane protein YtvI [Bacillota bacterium]
MGNFLKKFFISFIIIIIMFLFLNFSLYFLTPFVIAVIFASLINPMVKKIMDLSGLERSYAAFIALFFFIGIIFIIIFFGFTKIYLELENLLQNMPDYSTLGNRIQWLIEQNKRINEIINNLEISKASQEVLHNNIQILYNGIRNTVLFLANNILDVLGKLPLILTVLFLSFIATFFISRDIDEINEFIMGLFPDKFRKKIYEIEKSLINSAVGFIRAELILISITGFMTTLGLIFIQNKYAILLGCLTAILDLIPILGPGLLFIPIILFNMITGNIFFSLKLLILYTLISAFRQGIEGKIIGTQLGLHPLVTMISFYAGYRLFGTIGFIIGPTLVVLCKAVFKSGIISDIKM